MASGFDFNEVLEKVLKGKKLSYTTKDGDKYKIHTIPLRLSKSCTDIRLKMRISSSGDAKIWSYVFSGVSQRRRNQVLEAMNSGMASYRFISFYVDSENDLCAGYDFEVFGDEIDASRHIKVIYEMFVDVLDKCMIDINKAVWSDEPEEEETEILRLNLFGDEED